MGSQAARLLLQGSTLLFHLLLLLWGLRPGLELLSDLHRFDRLARGLALPGLHLGGQVEALEGRLAGRRQSVLVLALLGLGDLVRLPLGEFDDQLHGVGIQAAARSNVTPTPTPRVPNHRFGRFGRFGRAPSRLAPSPLLIERQREKFERGKMENRIEIEEAGSRARRS